jgi:hypothetical protein
VVQASGVARYHHTTIKTIRHHLLNLAGKVVHTARRCFLIISDPFGQEHRMISI